MFSCPHVVGQDDDFPQCTERFYLPSTLMKHREQVHGYNGIIYDSVHPWFDPASDSRLLGGTFNPALLENISPTQTFQCQHVYPATIRRSLGVGHEPQEEVVLVRCNFVTTNLRYHCLHRIYFHGYLPECEPRDSIHAWVRDKKYFGGNLCLDYVKWWRKTNWHLHNKYIESLSIYQDHDDIILDEDQMTAVNEDIGMTSRETDSRDMIAVLDAQERFSESIHLDEELLKSDPSLRDTYLLSPTQSDAWSTDSPTMSPLEQSTPLAHECSFCITGSQSRCIMVVETERY